MNTVLEMDAWKVAPRILGALLTREINGHILRGRIIEVEAYDQSDAASHSFNGRTARNDVMFGPAGQLYVYFTYGMHYCMNVVTGKVGHGSAVLIRAIEPTSGLRYMEKIRARSGIEVANGPAKLCQALQIDRSMNGHNLSRLPLTLQLSKPLDQDHIVQTTRIGISKAKNQPWRWFVKGNPFVSRQR